MIDLSQASTNRWDADNRARRGTGMYDSNHWAVVFHYTSVTIDAGAAVTFINHPNRAPVVWLVDGDVTINGTVCLDGGRTAGSHRSWQRLDLAGSGEDLPTSVQELVVGLVLELAGVGWALV